MHGRQCALCGERDAEHFETIVDNSYAIVYEMCTKCGLVRQWPRLSDEELLWYNNHSYRASRSLESIEDYEKLRARVQYRLMFHEIGPLESVLDIGCGSGALLSHLKEHWPRVYTYGVEPINELAIMAGKKGHVVFPNIASSPVYGAYDLITMSHVLEHLPYPGRTLYALRGRCKPGGKLYVEVPNLIDDLALEKTHLWGFTEDTLVALLELSGWKPLWVKKHGAPKHRWLNAYISVLAELKDDFFASKVPIPTGVKRARRFGKLRRMWAIATSGFENNVDSIYGVW